MITIDPEFKALIPPLLPEERKGLEESILKEGCRDALVVWKGHDILVDGHNRYEICTAHGKPFETVEMEFASRDDAMVWIIDNQFSRRNLTPFARGELALKRKHIIAAKGGRPVSVTVQETLSIGEVRRSTLKRAESWGVHTLSGLKDRAKAPEEVRKPARPASQQGL